MLLVVAASLIGAFLQRVSGIGFAIVAAPFMVVAIGPAQGIVVVQLCGVTAASMVFLRLYRDVDWVTLLRLLPASVLGVLAGTYLSQMIPRGIAQLLIGGLLVVSLLALTMSAAAVPLRRTWVTCSGAGATAGALTTLAGVGGVVLTLFQRLTQWDQRQFSATLQPYLMILSTMTVTSLIVANPGAWPQFSAAMWAALFGSIVLGLAVGEWGAKRISTPAAAKLTLVISWLGAIITVVDGIIKL